jgi:hypothetical protein
MGKGNPLKRVEREVRRSRDKIKNEAKRFERRTRYFIDDSVDWLKDELNDILGDELYDILSEIGDIAYNVFLMTMMFISPEFYIMYNAYYWHKSGYTDLFAGFKNAFKRTLLASAQFFMLLGMSEERAYRITGYIFIAVVAIICAVISYFTMGALSAVSSTIMAYVSAAIGSIIAGMIAATIVTVVISTVMTYIVSRALGAIAKEMAAINTVLADLACWVQIAGMLGMAAGSLAYGFYNTGDGVADFIALFQDASESTNFLLAAYNAGYTVYGTYQAFVGYLKYKRELQYAYNEAEAKIRGILSGYKDQEFDDAMSFASGSYYEDFAGQFKYFGYQPARELYMSNIVVSPFDGSTDNRFDGQERSLDMQMAAGKFGINKDILIDITNPPDLIKLGRSF